MESSRKRTLGILIAASVGLTACCIRLYFETKAPPSVVYRQAGPSEHETDSLGNASQFEEVSREQTDIAVSSVAEESVIDQNQPIPVYICGSVAMPGVYYVARDTFLFQLVDMAGGLCSDAASENINMVYCLDQPVSIYIPSITEENTSESVRVKLPSSGFFREDVNQYIWGREDDDDSEYSQDAESSGKININSADEDALMRLSGVGEVTAAAIIRYRSEHGLFEKIEDIMKVPGIKQGRFDAIKDMIVV